MTRVLLTGAGFSYNWGGWLAKEAFEYLLGCDSLSPTVRHLLWKYHETGEGFEGALRYLQSPPVSQRSAVDLAELLSALSEMFDRMNSTLAAAGFDFPPYSASNGITAFLGRFDAIFTLNQDLLLERHYTPPVGAWAGWGSPGTRPRDSSFRERWDPRIPDVNNLRVSSNTQPYFKLHGSSNFLTDDRGEPLLVMGGNKVDAIGKNDLLTWYSRQFFEYICRPNCRLMVIGYSFGDGHINQTILNAARSGTGLQIFVVDPVGSDVIDKRAKDLDPMAWNFDVEMVELLRPLIRGASRRPLSSTFGHDEVEYSKLRRFLDL